MINRLLYCPSGPGCRALAVLLWLFCSTVMALDGTLLVANRSGGSVSFIDLPTGIEIARVPVGPTIPHEVAVSPDGRLAMSTEYGAGEDHGRYVILIEPDIFSVP